MECHVSNYNNLIVNADMARHVSTYRKILYFDTPSLFDIIPKVAGSKEKDIHWSGNTIWKYPLCR